jgi:tetratricopeptide (TPR) repeat protein
MGLLLAVPLLGQQKPAAAQAQPPVVQEEEPPEEDPSLQPRQYTFNPLEAARNVTAGNFYYKKGNYRAASRRYEEAVKWDPTSGDILLKLASSYEKLHDYDSAREAYNKYLKLDLDAKAIDSAKKKLAKLPPPRAQKASAGQ